jgi:hypothetical protein
MINHIFSNIKHEKYKLACFYQCENYCLFGRNKRTRKIGTKVIIWNMRGCKDVKGKNYKGINLCKHIYIWYYIKP